MRIGSAWLGDKVWDEVLVMMGSGWLGARVWWPGWLLLIADWLTLGREESGGSLRVGGGG